MLPVRVACIATPDGRMGWDEKGYPVYVVDQAARGRSAANPSVIDSVKLGIEEFWKQMVVDWARSLPTPNPTVVALGELASRLERTVLVSHSQSGIYPFQTMALSARGIAGVIAVEPGACPDADADVSPYLMVPIVVLWGDFVTPSSRWAPRLQGCKAFAEAVKRRGGSIENVELPTLGIRGNSHMLMQDTNNLEIADWLLAWIDRNVKATLHD